MFEELLPSVTDEENLPYDLLVERTEGYSGSDIRLVCKEAAMQPLRRLMAFLEDKQEVVPEDGITGNSLLYLLSLRNEISSDMLLEISPFLPGLRWKLEIILKRISLRDISNISSIYHSTVGVITSFILKKYLICETLFLRY